MNTRCCVYPSKRDFLQSVQEAGISPLYREIPYRKPSEYFPLVRQEKSFLLESIKGSFNIAQYSYIGFDPYLEFRVKDSLIEINNVVRRSLRKRPLAVLKEYVYAYPQKPISHLPPFQGGAVGLLSYDFVRYLENIPRSAIDDLHIPDAHFFLVDKVIAFDHKSGKAWIITCPGAEYAHLDRENSDFDWSVTYDEAVESIHNIDKLLERGMRTPHITTSGTRTGAHSPVHRSHRIEMMRGMSKKRYMDMVKKAKDYIAAGDIFQANLSQRISAPIDSLDTWDIYSKLSHINPSPFACYLDFGEYSLVSSSPERLIRVNSIKDTTDKKGRQVDTRPIAGTRPRGNTVYEDEVLRTDLLLKEKERAEHIMLIDLERNDLGRVCDYGSVKVDELMITEDYSHVIHIVSNITGELAEEKDCFDVIKAVFPGGTITGVPKVRCMEIIDELEPLSRGPYTGSVGHIGFSRAMDMNIVIRTFLVKNNVAHVQAGAGIVADSDPEKEYYETLNKAEALVLSL